MRSQAGEVWDVERGHGSVDHDMFTVDAGGQQKQWAEGDDQYQQGEYDVGANVVPGLPQQEDGRTVADKC